MGQGLQTQNPPFRGKWITQCLVSPSASERPAMMT